MAIIPPLGHRALILGRSPSGEAARALLALQGAQAVVVDAHAAALPTALPDPDLVVVSADTHPTPPLARRLREEGIPVLGERELAFQKSLCLHVAVTGASGKRTTCELIAHLLRSAGRRVEIADAYQRPASQLVTASRDLDLMVHAVELGELEHFQYFRPVVGVLLNAPADHPDYAGPAEEYVARLARLFRQQQVFDWAIVQSAALAQMQSVSALPPGKLITFSATSRQADLGVDHGLLVSRLQGWVGPLWDLSRGVGRGEHFAEDLLAALAVGRVLRLPLEDSVQALEGFQPLPGRCEVLGEIGGVRYVDDGECRNLDSLAKALLSLAPTPSHDPSIWLIAGGDSGGRQFYDLGPVLSPRVKHAFVYGEAATAMRSAWNLFTPCSPVPSLLDAANRAADQAAHGDVILFSPACPDRGGSTSSSPRDPAFREVFSRRRQLAVPSVNPQASSTGAGGDGGIPAGGPSRPSPLWITT